MASIRFVPTLLPVTIIRGRGCAVTGSASASASRWQAVKEEFFLHRRPAFGGARMHSFAAPLSSLTTMETDSKRDTKAFALGGSSLSSTAAGRQSCGGRFEVPRCRGRGRGVGHDRCVQSIDTIVHRKLSTSLDAIPEAPSKNSDLNSVPDLNLNSNSNSNSDSDLVGELQSKLGPEDKAMIEYLMKYKAARGDCHVPTGNTKIAREERSNLGVPMEVAEWVVRQRKQYRASRSSSKKGKIHDSLAARIITLESIGFMWSCREANWQRYFNKLERLYRRTNKRGGVLLKVREQDDPHLYSWMDQQRKAHKKGTLPSERENLLREIDFVFDPNDARWWDNYRKLCAYHQEHGNTMVPLVDDENENNDNKNSNDNENDNDNNKNNHHHNHQKKNKTPNYLGQWVARQRRLHHGNALAADRTDALNAIGFSWDPEAESWDKYYHQLCGFYRKHNHTRVPKSMGPLWNWVDRQRRSYRKRLRLGDGSNTSTSSTIDCETGSEGIGSLLTKENVQKLSTIGFEWEEPSPTKMETEDRIKRLMNVTFELSIHDENWAKHFDKLCAFQKEFGHFSVPTGGPREYKELNAWVRHTRYLYNANKLPSNRVRLLDSIGFPWTAEIARWDRLYRELLSFHETHGHTNVPAHKTELHRWTQQQQKAIGASFCESIKAEDERESESESDSESGSECECEVDPLKAGAKTQRTERWKTLREIFSEQS